MADRPPASGAGLRDQPRSLGDHDGRRPASCFGDSPAKDRLSAQAPRSRGALLYDRTVRCWRTSYSSSPPRSMVSSASRSARLSQLAAGIEGGSVWTVLNGRDCIDSCRRGRRGGPVDPCRRHRPFRTRSSADRPAGPQFGLPPGRPRSPFWPISIRNRLFIAASPRARRTVASSAWA